MEKLLLDGKWELHYAPEHAGKTTAQAVKEDPAYTHIEANVPGNAELDLYAAGKAPEPFWGTNLYAFRPYEFYEWWYTRTFFAPQALADRLLVAQRDDRQNHRQQKSRCLRQRGQRRAAAEPFCQPPHAGQQAKAQKQ